MQGITDGSVNYSSLPCLPDVESDRINQRDTESHCLEWQSMNASSSADVQDRGRRWWKVPMKQFLGAEKLQPTN